MPRGSSSCRGAPSKEFRSVVLAEMDMFPSPSPAATADSPSTGGGPPAEEMFGTNEAVLCAVCAKSQGGGAGLNVRLGIAVFDPRRPALHVAEFDSDAHLTSLEAVLMQVNNQQQHMMLLQLLLLQLLLLLLLLCCCCCCFCFAAACLLPVLLLAAAVVVLHLLLHLVLLLMDSCSSEATATAPAVASAAAASAIVASAAAASPAVASAAASAAAVVALYVFVQVGAVSVLAPSGDNAPWLRRLPYVAHAVNAELLEGPKSLFSSEKQPAAAAAVAVAAAAAAAATHLLQDLSFLLPAAALKPAAARELRLEIACTSLAALISYWSLAADETLCHACSLDIYGVTSFLHVDAAAAAALNLLPQQQQQQQRLQPRILPCSSKYGEAHAAAKDRLSQSSCISQKNARICENISMRAAAQQQQQQQQQQQG
ncbi:hypothetical protein Emag_004097 [Eimeria magna]